MRLSSSAAGAQARSACKVWLDQVRTHRRLSAAIGNNVLSVSVWGGRPVSLHTHPSNRRRTSLQCGCAICTHKTGEVRCHCVDEQACARGYLALVSV
jgi:hypothetical protein